MKVFYKIPDRDDDFQNRLNGLLYENYRLRILLALAPVQKLTDASPGIIFIERLTDSIEVRYEFFTSDLELICRYLIAQIRVKQKARY